MNLTIHNTFFFCTRNSYLIYVYSWNHLIFFLQVTGSCISFIKFTKPCSWKPWECYLYAASTSKIAMYMNQWQHGGQYVTNIFLKSFINGHLEHFRYSSLKGYLKFIRTVADGLFVFLLKQVDIEFDLSWTQRSLKMASG